MATIKFMERKVDFKTEILTISFEDGASAPYPLSSLSDTMIRQLALWGLNSKLGDCAANFSKSKDCAGARGQLGRAWGGLTRNEWSVKMSPEERAAAQALDAEELLMLAFGRVYGDNAAKAESNVTKLMAKKGLDRKGAVAFWSGTDKLKTAIAAIKVEREAKKVPAVEVDADDLMADLMMDE